jgi:8-oxo-dGTP diphosphatase
MSTSLVSLASLVNAFSPVIPQVRVAAIIIHDKRVLLVEHRKRGQRYWVLPGGRLEANETLDAALRRELREELGLTARIGRLAIVSEMIAPDRHVVNLIYLAEVGEMPEPRLDAKDPVLSDWKWVPLTELRRLDFRPPIADAIIAAVKDGASGTVRVLGDTWRSDRS